jgi:O-acetyl-ADP-ribose deacetylase (regulator of RNase III)
MIIYKKGDLLEATEDIICHQCNTYGLFGGGLAYQIKQVYPLCEKQTIKYLQYNKDFMGNYYLYVNKEDKRMIANCFTQDEDYKTNYEMLERCFTELMNNCKDMKQSIALAFNYGCGIANGDWNKVLKILKNIFTNYDLTIYRKD